jgi:hypothetical protein
MNKYFLTQYLILYFTKKKKNVEAELVAEIVKTD